MDFSLSDDQTMMQDIVKRFISQEYGFETRQSLLTTKQGYSEDMWQTFAEMGWLALPIDDQYGGLGGTIIDTMLLQIELGKGLVLEPFFATAIHSASLLSKVANDDVKQQWLPKIAAGETKFAVAYAEQNSSFRVTQCATSASVTGTGYLLQGKKCVVLGAPSADQLLVTANTDTGLGVFVVDPSLAGISFNNYATNDGHRAAEITFDQVEVLTSARLDSGTNAQSAFDASRDEAIVALAAEALGIMQKLLAATGEHLHTRQQFGRKIGEFQVLQHRVADMFMALESTQSLLYYAALKIASNADDRNRATSMVKVKLAQTSRLVGQTAVQLHGGMGITDELDVGHYFKRLTCINALMGSGDQHMQRLLNHAA